MKVIVIGAGISGILASIRLPRRIPNLDLVVYDKNPEVGGTWYENKYPGIACDIPAHVYQASFEPNPNWSQFYASGNEILEYWKGIVAKYDVRKYMKLSHKIIEARFNEAESKWHVKVENCLTGDVLEDSCDVLYACIGALNDWKWPEIPGLQSFKGRLLHSAAWDESWDATGLNVAVIGSGSSAIQIVPALQPKAKHLDNYVRGQAWIAPPIAEAEVRKHTLTESNFHFTPEELSTFNEKPEVLLEYRKKLDSEIQSMTKVTLRGSFSEKAAADFTANMRAKLAKKPEILDKILPSFMPGCRRITPGPGYLEALVEDNVSFVSEAICGVTEDGIMTIDGQLRKVDAIICATGFDTSFTKRFPIYGVGGMDLASKWQEYPDTYISLSTRGAPNLFIAHGPNSGLGVGSLSIVLERTCDYVCNVVAKMQKDRIATIQPKQEACDLFVDYCKQYFEKTVFTLPCRSWYKRGTTDGPVSALWPGSALHYVKTLEKPRFEDYDFTYVGGNKVAWLGDGFTVCERDDVVGKSKYLDPENVDYPSLTVASV
ncbi:flavin-binding monooxygenase [Thelonectria olida]|uniref:Flavin-binding monooxygenase n=1 Tax=Thelonectria olida TaxID=1576542 RepID=A0A9P8VXA6_9HYPO|nr:flavin-binding monooxygenase [Thelonectria olida]